MRDIIKSQIEQIRMQKFYDEKKINDIQKKYVGDQLMIKLLEYERELLKLESRESLKTFDKLPMYEDDFKAINAELGLPYKGDFKKTMGG